MGSHESDKRNAIRFIEERDLFYIYDLSYENNLVTTRTYIYQDCLGKVATQIVKDVTPVSVEIADAYEVYSPEAEKKESHYFSWGHGGYSLYEIALASLILDTEFGNHQLTNKLIDDFTRGFIGTLERRSQMIASTHVIRFPSVANIINQRDLPGTNAAMHMIPNFDVASRLAAQFYFASKQE